MFTVLNTLDLLALIVVILGLLLVIEKEVKPVGLMPAPTRYEPK
jgi:hypothetical protein